MRFSLATVHDNASTILADLFRGKPMDGMQTSVWYDEEEGERVLKILLAVKLEGQERRQTIQWIRDLTDSAHGVISLREMLRVAIREELL